MAQAERDDARSERAKEHGELRAALKALVQRSVTSATRVGRTVENPERAAEYVVNALLEYPDGHDLIRRVARHVDAVAGPGHVANVPAAASEPNPPKAGR